MKIEVKYIKGEEHREVTFEKETVNDAARGLLNVLCDRPMDDYSLDDTMIELLSNERYYRDGGTPGDFRSYVAVLGGKNENLLHVELDGEVIYDK